MTLGATPHPYSSLSKLVASYKDVSDPPDVVVKRARRLLMLERCEYNMLEQSCETIAVSASTGVRPTLTLP